MEGRIAPWAQMQRCPFICPGAKRLSWYVGLHFKSDTFCLLFFFSRPASFVTKIWQGLFSIPSLATLHESPSKYCLMTVSLDIMFRNRSCTWCSFSESSGCRPTNFLNHSKLKSVTTRIFHYNINNKLPHHSTRHWGAFFHGVS